MLQLAALLAAAVPLSWLVPFHFLPWLSAHNEFMALLLVALAGAACGEPARVPRLWVAAVMLALASVVVQGVTGLISFAGDAVMAALYLLIFLGSMALGSALVQPASGPSGTTIGRGRSWSLFSQSPGRWTTLDAMALGTLVSGLLSVSFASMQWLDVYPFPLPIARMRPGDRPYANLAQANHYCTAVFLALCALAWLRETRKVGAVTWGIAGAFLLAGLAMGASRTSWIQLILAFALVSWYGRTRPGVVRPTALAVMLGLFALLVASWPGINQALLAPAVRDAAELADAGVRLPLWRAMLDAITRQPWSGWGWQQVSVALGAVATDHPAMHRYFEHGHNLVLDLLVWAGVPVGSALIGFAALALMRQLRALPDPRAVWMVAGVLGLLAHSMVEFPIEYAYFLVPAGLGIGTLHALQPAQAEVRVSRGAFRATWIVALLALGAIAAEYLQVENGYRNLRLQMTLNAGAFDEPMPTLHILTQQRAYQSFIRTEARPGMSAEELAAFRRVGERFAHPPVLLRVALALGLNGEAEAAHQVLKRLCSMHLPARCDEGREAWIALQGKFAVLQAIPAPGMPGHSGP